MSQSPPEFPSDRAGIAELAVSDRHRLLADERRRATLELLTSQTMPVELEELAAAVATREADGEATTPDAVDRVAIILHHKDLPKLDEAGAIEYEPSTGRITSVYVTEPSPQKESNRP